MANYLQLLDFKGGKYDIPDAYSQHKTGAVQETINKYEKVYIYKLLGVELGQLFLTYITTTPAPPANIGYDYIKLPFAADNPNYCFGPYPEKRIIISNGVKEWLKACIFYEYNKTTVITSQPGATQPKSSTGNIQQGSSSTRFAENKLNDELNTGLAIQWYCKIKKPEAFPKYNGTELKIKASNLF